MRKEETKQPVNLQDAPILEMVRIHTAKFRCLAYRDMEGRWWDKNHKPVMEPVLSWENL